MDTMTDRALTCADCGQEFAFTASEQQFYADRQFSDPRRCPSCRATRKLSRGGFGGDQAAGTGYGGGVRWGVQRRRARDVQRHVLELRPRGPRAVPAERLQARLLQRLLPPSAAQLLSARARNPTKPGARAPGFFLSVDQSSG